MAATAKTLRVVTIFLASPGDTSDERGRIRYGVERVNRLVARANGIQYELIGWEDLPSGTAARTQEVINPAVRDCDIFIGVLSKRFGRPTGKAESGTIEEYSLAKERAETEDAPPLVKMYFRELDEEDLKDPGPQLRKLLRFKKRVSDTTLYHEFGGTEELGRRIEEELADLVNNRAFTDITQRVHGVRAISESSQSALATLVKGSASGASGVRRTAIGDATAHDLAARGLVRAAKGKIMLANSLTGFLSICAQLLDSDYSPRLLQSEYYSAMAKQCLPQLIEARFHTRLDEGFRNLLIKLSKVSPSVARYLFMGDTTLFDNIAEHAASIAQDSYAQAVMLNNLLHQALLRYGTDGVSGQLLDVLDGCPIAAQVFTAAVSATHESGLAYHASSKMPQMRIRAGQDIDAGQLVSGPPALSLRAGTLMAHMEEFELSLSHFDAVLRHEGIANSLRVAALNNRGIMYQRAGMPDEALIDWLDALLIAPNAPEPTCNLARLIAPEAKEGG